MNPLKTGKEFSFVERISCSFSTKCSRCITQVKIMSYLVMNYQHQRNPKGQSRMDNQETLAQSTGRGKNKETAHSGFLTVL